MKVPHISVCVCSYKRPRLLQRTLDSLRCLVTEGRFKYSIVIADNDDEGSAKLAVEEFKVTCPVEVTYCIEPRQNISLARNAALKFARGDFVAWIDDDEYPDPKWLLLMFLALKHYHWDGVLGPVKPVFETAPPKWIIQGRFFEKPRRKTGMILRWHQTSTANVLVRREILEGLDEPFRREFGSGLEDVDFFKRMVECGRVFGWCDEAVVSEIVPPTRWTRAYLVRRALLRGRNGKHFADVRSILKSVVALPLYAAILPILFLCGQHLFVRYLMKIGDHAGKLIGVLGLKVLGDKYLAG